MGVYINMEMPKSRGEYDLRLYIDSDGTATVEGSYCRFEGEPFEAVPVPPHGDLIDRDALKVAICSRLCIKSEKYLSPEEATIVNEIFAAPTIIPAEEGE